MFTKIFKRRIKSTLLTTTLLLALLAVGYFLFCAKEGPVIHISYESFKEKPKFTQEDDLVPGYNKGVYELISPAT